MSNIFVPSEIFVPQHLRLQEILNEHERAHWLADEADMRQDVEQWKNGTIREEEKAFIKMILRFFTQADTNVCGAYVSKLLPMFGQHDMRMMLLSFANREVTHQLGYKRLNDTLGYDDAAFMEEFLAYEEMRAKHEFMIAPSDLSTVRGRAEYLAKQVLMEGVNLFSNFAMLLSFSQEGKLPGMVSVNQWSIADESLHVAGLVEGFHIILRENPSVVVDDFKKVIYETARQVVAMEDASIDLCYSVGSTNVVKAPDVKQYVRYVCDYRMKQLGLKEQFGVDENPIEWIDAITSNTFGNFFETTTVQYSKNALVGDWVYPSY